jgi:hypothetical protein
MPNSGSSFIHWTGACIGTIPCSVTMSAGESVAATFNVSSPTACGNTLNWTDPSCQVIGSGALNTAQVNGVSDPSAWSVISRHGEYGQNETECNIPSAISVANSLLAIRTTASAYTCGDFNTSGVSCPASGCPTAGNTAPSSWPYTTAALQWANFNFTYGTVISRFKLPNSNTGLWPSIWMLGSNCQTLNPYSGDTGVSGCPNSGASGYREIDIVECWPGTWCQTNAWNPNQSPCAYTIPNDLAYHVIAVSWTAGSISETLDGSSNGCSYSGAAVPSSAMFLIMLTQTCSSCVEGPPVNANLPATFVIDYVKVCDTSLTAAQCSTAANNAAGVIFYDDFTNGSPPAPPSGLTATVK